MRLVTMDIIRLPWLLIHLPVVIICQSTSLSTSFVLRSLNIYLPLVVMTSAHLAAGNDVLIHIWNI